MPGPLRAASAALFLSLFAFGGVQAAEIKVMAVGALTGAFKELVPHFENASGHRLVVQYQATPVLLKQIEAGEPFDVAIVIAGPLNDPARQQFFTSERTAVSSVGLGAAVRSGTPKPDIGSAGTFKQALLNAKSVAILPDSVNGKHFMSVFDRLGIGDDMKAKIRPQKAPEHVAEAVAKGEADMALFVANLLISVPGVEYVGPIPDEFQQRLVFTAAVGAKAKEPEAANALVKFLISPAAAAAMRANGMDVPQP